MQHSSWYRSMYVQTSADDPESSAAAHPVFNHAPKQQPPPTHTHTHTYTPIQIAPSTGFQLLPRIKLKTLKTETALSYLNSLVKDWRLMRPSQPGPGHGPGSSPLSHPSYSLCALPPACRHRRPVRHELSQVPLFSLDPDLRPVRTQMFVASGKSA